MGGRVFQLRRASAAVGLIIATAAPAWAQGEAAIRGRAVAAANGSALAGVTVSLKPASGGDGLTTMTDDDGRFSFQGLRPGQYVVSGERDGFVLRELGFVLEPRETKTLIVSLDLPRVEVGVQVTGEAETSSIHPAPRY